MFVLSINIVLWLCVFGALLVVFSLKTCCLCAFLFWIRIHCSTLESFPFLLCLLLFGICYAKNFRQVVVSANMNVAILKYKYKLR